MFPDPIPTLGVSAIGALKASQSEAVKQKPLTPTRVAKKLRLFPVPEAGKIRAPQFPFHNLFHYVPLAIWPKAGECNKISLSLHYVPRLPSGI